jgi:uncharacterized LabA/DUF88 family protein
MYPHVAHIFIDGGYLRAVGRESSVPYPNPRYLAKKVVESSTVQGWASDPTGHANALLGRVTYYDALPETGAADPDVDRYWQSIELQEDVHLGFGALRGLKRKARQKGVDVQLAVDMLVGAFSSVFDIAVLVAGDADFVPVVEEVKRRGVMVAIVAEPKSLADDLRRVADRHVSLTPNSGLLASMP